MGQIRLNLDAHGIPDRSGQKKDQGDDPATRSQVYDCIARFDRRKLGKQDGINGKTIPGPGLNHLQTTIHESVNGFPGTKFRVKASGQFHWGLSYLAPSLS